MAKTVEERLRDLEKKVSLLDAIRLGAVACKSEQPKTRAVPAKFAETKTEDKPKEA